MKKRYYISTWFDGRAYFWNGIKWSQEYPDAILFESKRDTCRIAKTIAGRELQPVAVMLEHGNAIAAY